VLHAALASPGPGRFAPVCCGEDRSVIVETIIDWVGPLYTGAPAYLLIGAVVFLDRAAFTGLVIPGDLVLALGGVFAGRGDISVVGVLAIGIAAGIAGECASYWLGRRYGMRVVRRLPFTDRLERKLNSARRYFHRRGRAAVLIGRYVSVVGTFLPFVAGMSKMPVKRFLAYDVLAITTWAVGMTLLGYFLNSQIQLIDQILSRFGWGLLILVAVALLGRWVFRRRDRIQLWVSQKNPFV
jgi:membrane-associated protein